MDGNIDAAMTCTTIRVLTRPRPVHRASGRIAAMDCSGGPPLIFIYTKKLCDNLDR
jgi:hypothetical protein